MGQYMCCTICVFSRDGRKDWQGVVQERLRPQESQAPKAEGVGLRGGGIWKGTGGRALFSSCSFNLEAYEDFGVIDESETIKGDYAEFKMHWDK